MPRVPSNLHSPGLSDMQFGEVGWTLADVQTLFQVSDERAYQWLSAREQHIRERISELGWDVLEKLGRMDGLKLAEPSDPFWELTEITDHDGKSLPIPENVE